MRFADTSRAALLIVLCCAGAACSLMPDLQEAKAAPSPTAAPPAVAASAPKAPEPEAVPPAAQRAFDEARRAMRANRIEDAERGFKALAQLHPALAGPHANLGVIYRQANKLPESAAALETAVKLSPRQAVYFNQLGVTYRQMGQFAKARSAYESAIDIDPNYAAAVLNLGVLHDLYLWDGKRALELYDRYLSLTPGGDPTVVKWVADLKNRKPPQAGAVRKEKE